MKNDYEVRGETTVIFIKHRDGNLETMISTSSLERVMELKHSWHAIYSKDTKSYYVIGNIRKEDGKRSIKSMQRWIMGDPKGMVVDHINHDTLDNTLKNLRIVTNAENQQNRKGAASNSRSGVLGVNWNQCNKKWQVVVVLNGVSNYFGIYKTVEEAEKVAIRARRELMPYSTH